MLVCDLQCLVIAGLADYARPADKLSVRQSAALAATGLLSVTLHIVFKPKYLTFVQF